METLTFHEYPKESANNNRITKEYSGEYKAVIGKGSNKEIVIVRISRSTGEYVAVRFHTLLKGSKVCKSNNLKNVLSIAIANNEKFTDAHSIQV